MSSFFDMIDKYKFGLIAALTTYIVIFMYLQMSSYTHYFPIEPYHDGPRVEVPKDDIKLSPENILVPSDYNADVKNMVRDANDKREKSNEKYFQNKTVAQIEAEYKEIEKKMYEDAGGTKTREEIRKEMEKRKEQMVTNPESKQSSQETGNVSYSGNVMVEWTLTSRDPHQNNNWFVRNPGYTCGHGSAGLVTVIIKVTQNGDVTIATYDASQSRGANACMIEQAVKYAKKSRFAFSGSAPKIQEGRITYTFISQ